MSGLVLALGLIQGLALAATQPALEVKGNGARLVYLKGKVEVYPAGGKAWVSAFQRRNLAAGDRVKTRSKSLAEILLENGSVLRMAPATELVLKEPGVSEKVVTSVKLSVGQFWSNVNRLTRRGSKFEVDTQSATIGVRGTVLNTGVDPDQDVRVQVYEGKVEVWNPFQEAVSTASTDVIEAPGEVAPNFQEISREQWTVQLEVNQEVRVKSSGEYEKADIDPKAEAAKDEWVRFNQDRDRLLAQSKAEYLKGVMAVSDADAAAVDPAPSAGEAAP